jgi:Co/Zn/Cd efflux system component
MNDFKDAAFGAGHDHIFLGVGHEQNERKTWAVIALCSAMMLIEIVGGSMFGSLALVADAWQRMYVTPLRTVATR